jgi:hypothetical protein
MIKINDETGLPDLPEGHFWRFTEGTLFYKCELRKKWKFLGIPVSSLLAQKTMNGLNEEVMVRAATLIMEDREDYMKAESLLGDYPPKKIGTNEH